MSHRQAPLFARAQKLRLILVLPPMQRLISKARKAPRLARNAPRGAPTEQSLPKPPLELVHRLTRFHASEATSNSNGNENESEEHAQSILRWMQESPKCSSESDLKRMVDQYVDKKTPLAYILSELANVCVASPWRREANSCDKLQANLRVNRYLYSDYTSFQAINLSAM